MKKLFVVNAKRYNENYDFEVYWPASLDNLKNNAVMFVNSRNVHRINCLELVNECIIYVPNDYIIPEKIKNSNVVINVPDPRTSYCLFYRENNIKHLPLQEKCVNIAGALIADSAKVDETSIIMPFTYVGGNVTIGNKCYIGSGCKLVGSVHIGNNVVIRENTVIGADGLSTDRDSEGRAATMPQFGGVVIEDDVQVGANCVIARGAIDNTIIRRGSKIDNSTFISHNVVIGEDTFIVGETIMFGGASTGNSVFISGNSTIRNKVNIGSNAIVGMGSTVTKDVAPGITVFGNPARKNAK